MTSGEVSPPALTLGGVTANRDELIHLIEGLPDDQVEAVLADVRRRAQPRPPRRSEPFAWIGKGRAKNGVTDLSTNPEHLVGFGRD